MKKTRKHTGGPKKKLINYKRLDGLLGIQCTAEECASVLDMSSDTLDRRLREDKGVSFAEYFKQKSGTGRVSLRRRQFQMAKKNPTMAIWLGKQYLGQSDKNVVDVGENTLAAVFGALNDD